MSRKASKKLRSRGNRKDSKKKNSPSSSSVQNSPSNEACLKETKKKVDTQTQSPCANERKVACWTCGRRNASRCRDCAIASFCSPACRNQDAMHLRYCSNELSQKYGRMGIQNLSATCYLASSLQLLAAVPSFRITMAHSVRAARMKVTPPPPQGSMEILKAYNAFLMDWIQADWPLDISSFFDVVRKWSCFKDIRDQEDAQEFSSWLIDKLHEGIDLKEVHVQNIERKSGEGILRWTDRIIPQLVPSPEESPLLHSYGGLYLDSTSCLECSKRSHSLQPFSLLPLSLPTPSEPTLPCRVWYFPNKLSQPNDNGSSSFDVIGTWVNIPMESTVWTIREQLANHFMISPKNCLVAQSNYPIDFELSQSSTSPRLVPRLTAGSVFHGHNKIVGAIRASETQTKIGTHSKDNDAPNDPEELIMNEEKNVDVSFNEFTTSSPPVLLCYESSFPWLYTELQESGNSDSNSFFPRPHYLDKTTCKWKRPPPSSNSYINTVALSLVIQIILRWQPFPHPTRVSKCTQARPDEAADSYGSVYNDPDQGPNSEDVQKLYKDLNDDFRRQATAFASSEPDKPSENKDATTDYSRVNIVILPSNLGDPSIVDIPDTFPLLLAIPRWVTTEQLREYLEEIISKYMKEQIPPDGPLMENSYIPSRRVVDCKASYERLTQEVEREVNCYLQMLEIDQVDERNFLLEENAHILTTKELLSNLYERHGDSVHIEEAYCHELIELIMTYQNIWTRNKVFEKAAAEGFHRAEQNDSDFVSIPPDGDDVSQALKSLVASSTIGASSTGATNSTPDEKSKQCETIASNPSESDFISPEIVSVNVGRSTSLAGSNSVLKSGNYTVTVTAPDLVFCYTCPIAQQCNGWEWISAEKRQGLCPEYGTPLNSPCLIHWNPSEATFIDLINEKLGGEEECTDSIDCLPVDNSTSDHLLMDKSRSESSDSLYCIPAANPGRKPTVHYNCVISAKTLQSYGMYERAVLGSGLYTAPLTLVVDLKPEEETPASHGVSPRISTLLMDKDFLHKVYERGKPKAEHPISLESLIYKSHVDELLRGENAIVCENCKAKRLTRRRHKIWSFGDVIFFQLNRFQQGLEDIQYSTAGLLIDSFNNFGNIDKPMTRKNRAEVNFVPDGLDLTWLQAKSFWGYEESKVYDLVGIINHEGSSLMCGHYTALTRRDRALPWYVYDDETVVMKDSIQSSDRKNAYILAYVARSE